MAELIARFGVDDEVLLRRVLGVDAAGATRAAPDRIVVDAHVASRAPNISAVARRAGRPFLIDPQTHFLQDAQHAGFPWVGTPFGRAAALRPDDLSTPSSLDALVESCLEYQLAHGATALIPPYVHIERAGDGWTEIQAALWTRTARHLATAGIQLPVIAVAALGWTTLAPEAHHSRLTRLAAALQVLQPTEIALAASKVDQGARPADRLADFISTIRFLRRIAPVIAWQQGVLGEAAVAGGAVAYECGVGWRERCDLQSSMRAHRTPPREDSGFGARPVYIPQLGRSLPKRTVSALLDHRRLGAELLCMDPNCCAQGRTSLLGDAREHALTSRSRLLAELSQVARPSWQWRLLADRADLAVVLADRINAYSGGLPPRSGISKIDTTALRAIQTVAHHRRQTLRRRRAA